MGKIEEFIKTSAGGFCMALADSVPGVSGSTVSFIMGFYDRFISSIQLITDSDRQKRRAAFAYLLKLFSGWALGFAGAVLFLSKNFQTHCYYFCSVFLGLTVVSVPFIIAQERETLRENMGNAWIVLAGIIASMSIFLVRFLLTKCGVEIGAVDFSRLTLGSCIFLFVSGMIAITAMLLPGISGSTFLLLFGVYMPAVSAAGSVLHGDLSVLPSVIIFVCGIGTGALLSSHLIHRFFVRHRNATVYFIIGLVIGSVFAIIQGPATLKTPLPAMTSSTFNIPGFFTGGILLILLEVIRIERQN